MTNLDSVHKEIDVHRGPVEAGEWLASIGVIDAPDAPFEYELIQDWYRPGAESYILDFQVNSLTRTERIIAKACIKLFSSATVQEWMGRRSIVEEIGIATPKLYSVKGPSYLEEYIPLTLREAYQDSDDENKSKLQEDFFSGYEGLLEVGFSPVSLHDARSHGSDVVLVDFGFDLGGIVKSSQKSVDSTRTEKTISDDFQQLVR